MLNALFVGRMDSGREHHTRRYLAERCACRRNEPSESLAVKRHRASWICTELPDTQRERADELLTELFGASGQRTRQQKYRIDAAHLGIYRNRLGALARDLHQ